MHQADCLTTGMVEFRSDNDSVGAFRIAVGVPPPAWPYRSHTVPGRLQTESSYDASSPSSYFLLWIGEAPLTSKNIF